MTESAVDVELGLDAEWARIELLGQCCVARRAGSGVDQTMVARLTALNSEVRAGREAGRWGELVTAPLGFFELDVLASVIAPEAEPRLRWLYQQLQPTGSSPYPCAAVLQELFTLRARHLGQLMQALSDGGRLRQLRLIDIDEGGVYAPIRPAPGVTARLLGVPAVVATPPGATRVNHQTGWDELLLPPDRIAVLHEFLHWIEHRDVVVTEWGGRVSGGPIALFTGPPGTGKTLAASVIAAQLGWPLYRVDLGALVSKYIGETEKNLNRLFSAVHGQPAVLQFDEAESLFGKRGEVHEARDRYANLEVSHLLARIEQHEGPCILTTNLRGHLDQAFARRFQVAIEFPRPDAATRTKLWRLHLPPRAPLDAAVDLALVGAAVHLTGGGIRNAALHAAFLAAAHRTPIGMAEIGLAVWRELGKDGRALSLADLGPLTQFVDARLLC
ncbi:MAG TPA: ATP-binding protein [Kofleriaceae bacterium]